MIDLHSHFLYGVDDGARNLDMTIRMLIQAETLGITKLLATPHVNVHTTPEIEKQIHNTFDSLCQVVKNQRIYVDLQLAAEVNMLENDLKWLDHSWVLIGDSIKYMLVETPFRDMPRGFSDTLFQIRLKNIIPVLAHPERNITFQKNPQLLIDWINQGCLVQADAGSLVGQFGKKCFKFADRLLKGEAIHLVGSDAHEPKWRNYHILAEAFQKIQSEYGNKHAQMLFDTNPGMIWEGKKVSIPPVDETALQSSFIKRAKDRFNL